MKALKKIWFKEISMINWDGKQLTNETVQVPYMNYAIMKIRVQTKFFIYAVKTQFKRG